MRCTRCGLKKRVNAEKGFYRCPACEAPMLADVSEMAFEETDPDIDIKVSNHNGCLNLNFPQPVTSLEIEPEMAKKFLGIVQDVVRTLG